MSRVLLTLAGASTKRVVQPIAPTSGRKVLLAMRAHGKAKMVARVAVMRKLLHAIFGMFKHQTAFDGSKLFLLPDENSRPQPRFSTPEVA